MRSYALLKREEGEIINIWKTSKEPLKLLPEDGNDIYVGYSDLDWPFDVANPENWKYWEGTERIWGWFNPDTKDFRTYEELDKGVFDDNSDGYDECCKCRDYKNGKPIGEIYYE